MFDAERNELYLIGKGIDHSISPLVHNHVLQSLDLPWTFVSQECESIDDVQRLLKRASFAGGVVTMPYKKAVMPYLDGLDELAVTLGACNNIYRAADGSLRGTNTDWVGVSRCLLAASSPRAGQPGLLIGAGGAAKAALYALTESLGCSIVYVLNRDVNEVRLLFNDVKRSQPHLRLLHIRNMAEAEQLQSPYYIVGTVPDFEPQSESEKAVQDMLQVILSQAQQKGVVLDMCYRPRQTRTLRKAASVGWTTIEGMGVVGYQILEQYRLWCGEEVAKSISTDDTWEALYLAVRNSAILNP